MIDNITQSNDNKKEIINLENTIIKNFEFCKSLNTYYFIQNSRRQAIESKDIKKFVKNFINEKIKQTRDTNKKQSLSNLKKVNELSALIVKIKNIDISDLELKGNLIMTKRGCYNLKTKRFNNNVVSEYETGCCLDTNAKAPKWQEFIESITKGDKEYAEYLQKVAGYWLYSGNNQQCAFFLIGTGANGKTVFLETIKYVLGSFATVVDKSMILKDNNKAKEEYVKLIGRKIAIINELEDTAEIKIDVFKRLVGQDSIDFHYKRERLEFVNNSKLIINTNSIPNLGASTNATWRRIRLLPFNNEYNGENRNIFLIEELKEESSGIFNWMLEGYDKWITSKSLEEPESIKDFTYEYKVMAEPLGGFYCKCIFGDDIVTRVWDLYEAYKGFCQENLIQLLSKEKFSQILSAKGFKRTRDKYGMRCFIGIKYNRQYWYYQE